MLHNTCTCTLGLCVCKSWGDEIIDVCIGQPPPHYLVSHFVASAKALSVNFIEPGRESHLIAPITRVEAPFTSMGIFRTSNPLFMGIAGDY